MTSGSEESRYGSKYHDLRLLPAAVAAFSSASLGIRTSAATAGALAAAVTVACLMCLASRRLFPGHKGIRDRKRRTLAGAPVMTQVMLMGFLAAIVLALSAVGWQRIPPEWEQGLADQRLLLAELRVDTFPVSEGDGIRFRAALLAGRWVAGDSGDFSPGETGTSLQNISAISLPVVVRAQGTGGWPGLNPGDRFAVPGVLVKHATPRTTAAVFVVRGPPLETIRQGNAVLPQLRRDFSDLAISVWPDSPDISALLTGMVLGDRSTQSPELDESMKVAGLTHLTAVSGSNCLMLVVGVLSVARWLRLPRRLALVCGGLALSGFVALVGPDPSVIRAAIMTTLGLLAVLGGRRSRSGPMLCLAVIGMLLNDPWLCVDFGFLLSVAATAGLLILGAPLQELLSRRLPSWLALTVAVPLSAQLFCAPLLVLLQPRLTSYSVLANLVAAVAVPPVTLLGMLAVLSATLSPPLAGISLWLAGLGAGWVLKVAQITVLLPGASLPWPGGAAGFTWMLLLSGLITAGVLLLCPRMSRGGLTLKNRAAEMALQVRQRFQGTVAGELFACCLRGSVLLFSGSLGYLLTLAVFRVLSR